MPQPQIPGWLLQAGMLGTPTAVEYDAAAMDSSARAPWNVQNLYKNPYGARQPQGTLPQTMLPPFQEKPSQGMGAPAPAADRTITDVPGLTFPSPAPGPAAGPVNASPPAPAPGATAAASSSWVKGPTAPSPSATAAQPPGRPAGQTFQTPINPLMVGPGQKAALSAILPEIDDKNYLQAPDKDKGEGRKTIAKGEQRLTQSSKTTGAIADPEFNRAYNRMLEGTPGLTRQRKDVDALRAGIQRILGSSGGLPALDIGPVMRLSDTWFGGQLAHGYKAPGDPRAMAVKLAETLQKAEGALTDDEINLLKGQLLDKFQTDLMAGLSGSRQTVAGAGGTSLASTLGQERLNDQRAQRAKENQDKAYGEVQKLVGKRGDTLRTLHETFDKIDQIIAKDPDHLPGYTKLPFTDKQVEVPFNWLKSEEGKDLARYAETVKATITRQYSGTAASDQEVRRKAGELGQALTAGPDQFKKALADLQDAIRKAEADRESTLSPDAKKVYDQNGDVLKSGDFGFKFGVSREPPVRQPSQPLDTRGEQKPVSADDLKRKAKERAKAFSK